MEMEEEASYKAHVIVLPFQGQGHMNPMIQFSKRLISKGIKITVATTLSISQSMKTQLGSISFKPIFDDLVECDHIMAGGLITFMKKFQEIVSKNLEEFIRKQEKTKYPIKCLVYDASFPWCLNVAKCLGIFGAAFFTQSCSSIMSYYKMVHPNDEWSQGGPASSLPDMSALNVPKVGSSNSDSDSDSDSLVLKLMFSQFSNINNADWVLFNSFDKLEEEVVKWMRNLYPVRTIGPTLPSMYLDKRIEDDKSYGFNLFKPNEDTYMTWLNTKDIGSVIYMSFGSAARLKQEQMEELAWGLIQSNIEFLWVVRESEEEKLPRKLTKEMSEKGLVVHWCSQLEVLSHKAIGCFMSHCGWNSTVEAVSLGVPMVGMPQFLDQFSDAKFVQQVWRVGVIAKVDEKLGIVRREEIKMCIKEVMEGERSEEMKGNACKWKECAKEAIFEGGSSDNNIEEIVAQILCN